MNALAIFRGYFRQLSTTNVDYFGLRWSFYNLTISIVNALMHLPNCVHCNEFSRHFSGVLSVTFEHQRWPLRPTCEHYNINEHPCHPSRYIRNFRPLSMTSSACISLHINLLLLRTRAICEHRYQINEHPRNPSGYFQELSTAIDDFFGLHQSSCKLTMTSNARYLWTLKNWWTPRQCSGVLSVTFDHYRWLLRLISIFI